MSIAMVRGLLLGAVGGVILLAAAAPASAKLLPLSERTYGVLISDRDRNQVLLTRDLNRDGDASDPGEVKAYFDATNQSGLPAPVGDGLTIFQASDRAIYVGDGQTDTVYRLFDKNRDGDANDPGEARIFFSGTGGVGTGNASGLKLPTPNGIAEDKDGNLYLVNAGTASLPFDGIYKLRDLNGDGDANDAGESAVWQDFTPKWPAASPFEVAIVDGVVYTIDTNGGQPDAIWRSQDINNDGDANDLDLGEASTLLAEPNAFGVPLGFAMGAGELGLYVMHETATGAATGQVFRLNDLDDSGKIDAADEAILVWAETQLPAGFIFDVGFALDVGPGDSLMLSLNSGSAGGKILVYLVDLNKDGDYMDAGETNIWGTAQSAGGFISTVRTAEFIAAAPEPVTAGLLGLGLAGVLGVRRARGRSEAAA